MVSPHVPPRSLVVTLHIDDQSARYFTALRDRHFPPAVNYLPAHITLFHNLPAANISQLSADAERCGHGLQVIPVNVTGLRFLGRGVAYDLESPPLAAFRRCLAGHWQSFLNAQDRQPFHPHITVQNKVSPSQARLLHTELAAAFEPSSLTGVGIDFWHYCGGPWEHAGFISF